MRASRSLRSSWYPITVICLLSIILLLRRDLTNLLSRYKSQTLNLVHDNSIFFELVAKKNITTILSQTGEYLIFPNVRKPNTEVSTNNDVTFVTHCSYPNLRYLPHLSQSWKGPISVAIFSLTPTKTLITIDLLRKCLSHVRDHVRFHLMMPLVKSTLGFVGLTPGEPNMAEVLEHWHENEQRRDLICQNIDSLLNNFEQIEQNYELSGNFDYPNNALRNVAWTFSYTDYVLNVDIDILPNLELRKKFIRFANEFTLQDNKKPSSKTAFVLPVFEIKKNVYEKLKIADDHFSQNAALSLDKKLITKLLSAGHARPFYMEVCEQCQNCTDYKKWLDLGETDEIKFADMEFYWRLPCEPFLILPRRTSVKFDERFRQYGYNRVSQILELAVAGWDFKVLNNAFLAHIGFKKGGNDFHDSKEMDMQRNYARFHNFKNELREKYKTLLDGRL